MSFLLGLFILGANLGGPIGLIIQGRIGALIGSMLGGILAILAFYYYVLYSMANMSPQH